MIAKQHGNLKFKLHSASRLHVFQSPVLRIWQLCQHAEQEQQAIELDNVNEQVLIIRRGLDITFELLSAGEFALLQACNNRVVFAQACVLALAVDPEFNINACLQKHIANSTIVDFLFLRSNFYET